MKNSFKPFILTAVVLALACLVCSAAYAEDSWSTYTDTSYSSENFNTDFLKSVENSDFSSGEDLQKASDIFNSDKLTPEKRTELFSKVSDPDKQAALFGKVKDVSSQKDLLLSLKTQDKDPAEALNQQQKVFEGLKDEKRQQELLQSLSPASGTEPGKRDYSNADLQNKILMSDKISSTVKKDFFLQSSIRDNPISLNTYKESFTAFAGVPASQGGLGLGSLKMDLGNAAYDGSSLVNGNMKLSLAAVPEASVETTQNGFVVKTKTKDSIELEGKGELSMTDAGELRFKDSEGNTVSIRNYEMDENGLPVFDDNKAQRVVPANIKITSRPESFREFNPETNTLEDKSRNVISIENLDQGTVFHMRNDGDKQPKFIQVDSKGRFYFYPDETTVGKKVFIVEPDRGGEVKLIVDKDGKMGLMNLKPDTKAVIDIISLNQNYPKDGLNKVVLQGQSQYLTARDMLTGEKYDRFVNAVGYYDTHHTTSDNVPASHYTYKVDATGKIVDMYSGDRAITKDQFDRFSRIVGAEAGKTMWWQGMWTQDPKWETFQFRDMNRVTGYISQDSSNPPDSWFRADFPINTGETTQTDPFLVTLTKHTPQQALTQDEMQQLSAMTPEQAKSFLLRKQPDKEQATMTASMLNSDLHFAGEYSYNAKDYVITPKASIIGQDKEKYGTTDNYVLLSRGNNVPKMEWRKDSSGKFHESFMYQGEWVYPTVEVSAERGFSGDIKRLSDNSVVQSAAADPLLRPVFTTKAGYTDEVGRKEGASLFSPTDMTKPYYKVGRQSIGDVSDQHTTAFGDMIVTYDKTTGSIASNPEDRRGADIEASFKFRPAETAGKLRVRDVYVNLQGNKLSSGPGSTFTAQTEVTATWGALIAESGVIDAPKQPIQSFKLDLQGDPSSVLIWNDKIPLVQPKAKLDFSEASKSMQVDFSGNVPSSSVIDGIDINNGRATGTIKSDFAKGTVSADVSVAGKLAIKKGVLTEMLDVNPQSDVDVTLRLQKHSTAKDIAVSMYSADRDFQLTGIIEDPSKTKLLQTPGLKDVRASVFDNGRLSEATVRSISFDNYAARGINLNLESVDAKQGRGYRVLGSYPQFSSVENSVSASSISGNFNIVKDGKSTIYEMNNLNIDNLKAVAKEVDNMRDMYAEAKNIRASGVITSGATPDSTTFDLRKMQLEGAKLAFTTPENTKIEMSAKELSAQLTGTTGQGGKVSMKDVKGVYGDAAKDLKYVTERVGDNGETVRREYSVETLTADKLELSNLAGDAKQPVIIFTDNLNLNGGTLTKNGETIFTVAKATNVGGKISVQDEKVGFESMSVSDFDLRLRDDQRLTIQKVRDATGDFYINGATLDLRKLGSIEDLEYFSKSLDVSIGKITIDEQRGVKFSFDDIKANAARVFGESSPEGKKYQAYVGELKDLFMQQGSSGELKFGTGFTDIKVREVDSNGQINENPIFEVNTEFLRSKIPSSERYGFVEADLDPNFVARVRALQADVRQGDKITSFDLRKIATGDPNDAAATYDQTTGRVDIWGLSGDTASKIMSVDVWSYKDGKPGSDIKFDLGTFDLKPGDLKAKYTLYDSTDSKVYDPLYDSKQLLLLQGYSFAKCNYFQ